MTISELSFHGIRYVTAHSMQVCGNRAALFQQRNIAGQYFPTKARMMNSALKKVKSFK